MSTQFVRRLVAGAALSCTLAAHSAALVDTGMPTLYHSA